VPVQSGARTHYSTRGLDPLRSLFCQRFPAFQASYEKRYAAFFGAFRLPLIARIRCPDCVLRPVPSLLVQEPLPSPER
jgi:hypothetical protein